MAACGQPRLARLAVGAPSTAAENLASRHPPQPALQAWVHADLDAARGTLTFSAASDSELTTGLAGVLVEALSGLTPAEVLEADGGWLKALGLTGAAGGLAAPRAAGWANMLEAMKRRARMLTADLPAFPSLLIRADGLEPQGAFAEAQAQYLAPDAATVARLARTLRDKRIGVVAHFYMDPQVGRARAARGAWMGPRRPLSSGEPPLEAARSGRMWGGRPPHPAAAAAACPQPPMLSPLAFPIDTHPPSLLPPGPGRAQRRRRGVAPHPHQRQPRDGRRRGQDGRGGLRSGCGTRGGLHE